MKKLSPVSLFILLLTVILLLPPGVAHAQTSTQDTLEIIRPDSLQADSLEADTQKSDFDTTLFYDARIIDTDVKARMTYLIGEAVVKYRTMTLTAEKITLDFNNNLLIAEGVPDTIYTFNEDSTEKKMEITQKGTPFFSDGGDKMSGYQMIYNYRSEKARIIRCRTDYEGGYYYGEHIKKVGDKVLNVSHGWYTTCDKEDDPHFHFRSRRMKVIPKSMVVAKPIVMYIGNIPVAALPFAFFPNKGGRHSGVIIPRYGQSYQEGRYIQGLGYYWATNDYTDVQTRMNYYDRSGIMLDGRFRYNKRYVLSGNVEGSITNKEFTTGRKVKRWDLRFYHNHTIDPTLRVTANGTFLSDDSFYKNYSSNINQRLTRQLRSNATVNKSWTGSKNSITVNVSHVRDLESGEQTVTMPQFSFRHSQRQIFKFEKQKGTMRTRQRRRDEIEDAEPRWYHSIYYSYNSQLFNTIRTGGTDSYGAPKPKKEDRRVDHSASLSMSSPSKFFGWLGWNQSLSYQERWFDKSLDYSLDTETKKIVADTVSGFASLRTFSYSTSANTKLYGMFPFAIGRIQAFRHVVTPSVSFSYQPDFSDPRWGYYQEIADSTGVIQKNNRFFYSVGRGARRNISFSVSNLFQMKTRGKEEDAKENKYDLFNIDFSSGYNFEADSLNLANLSTSMRANPTRRLSISARTSHSFYAFDWSQNRQVNQYVWDKGMLPRLTSLNLSLSLRLEGKRKSAGDDARSGKTDGEFIADYQTANQLSSEVTDEGSPDVFQEGYDRFQAEEDFGGLDISWSTSLSFNFNLSSYDPRRPTKRYYMDISGMKVKLTKNWDINYQAHIDLRKKQIVRHSFNFRRDLHCWEMIFRWVPSGLGREFYLRINVKATQLQDIKVEKRGGRSSILHY
ncbi:hypothetical protein JXJ21_11270 [candidate division KSB1 bacterium]|nr:hypothetical protein [candidate division KSB1 bacterium]